MFAKPMHAKSRRGAVAVLVAVALITILLFGSLAIDVGYICALTAEQQNTADAGALSGANLLQFGDPNTVMDHVRDIIGMNQKAQGYLSLDDQIIELGRWDSITGEFFAYPPEEWDRAYAVRVRAARNQTQLFFAPIAGISETDVWREAVAVGSGPCTGIWGLEGIKAGSIYTDSYDSTETAYDASIALENGDLCSGGEITIGGSIELHGDAMSGFGYDVIVNGGSGLITGLTTPNALGVEPVNVDFGGVETSHDNSTIGLTDGGRSPWKKEGWHLDIAANDNLVLPAGTFYLDSIKLSGGGTLTITGSTKLYVSGSIDGTGGAFVNESADPANFEIISSGPDVKISGGTGFYGTIFAPYADVTLTGNDTGFYGALVGKTVTLQGDIAIHVDESSPLTRMFDPPPPMLVK